MQKNTPLSDQDYIIIPNPIYDVVFKYLMADYDSALIILSTLIGQNIVQLDFGPLSHAEKKKLEQEAHEGAVLKEQHMQDPKTEDDIRLFHLDFTATIKLPDGTQEVVMIELQKENEPDDIFRFKRYISQNYQRKAEQEIIDPKTKAVKTVSVPIRLIPIFILNFRIEREINDLLIQTSHCNAGVFTKLNLQKENEFIDNLVYDIWVIQLPNLHAIEKAESYKESEYKTKLFQLLKLFDQKSIYHTNEHRLRLVKKIFPKFLNRIIERLQAADSKNPDLEEQMHAEDEYLRALKDRDNRIVELEQEIDEKDEALNQKDQELNQKDEQLNQKDEQLNEKDEQLNQKENIILQFAKSLKKAGKSTEEIAEQTKLPKQIIDRL